MQRILGYEEMKVLATEPQPEGVIIVDAVDELLEGYEKQELELLEARQGMAAASTRERIATCEEVLGLIEDRYGYVSRRRERCL